MIHPKVLFRVDANYKIGTGHLYECLGLAKYLGWPAVFCVANDKKTIKLIRRLGFAVKIIKTPSGGKIDEFNYLNSLIKKEKPDMVIFDLPKIKASDLKKISPRTSKIIVLNAILHEVKADMQIATVFSPHPKNKQYYGTKYILLRPAWFALKPKPPKKSVKNILIIFGGSDSGNFTLKALIALSVVPGNFRVNVILGGANPNLRKISQYSKKYPKLHTLHYNITDDRKLIKLMREADLALASGGYTLSELMRLGVPTIGLAQNEIEERHILPNFGAGSFINLGLGKKTSQKLLRDMVIELGKNYRQRLDMSKIAARVVDGKGLSRLEKIITNMYLL